ncbi:MAG: zinc-binding dehydrogenase [Firmicutes bacterium]|nr:zinc-binding dehydrogenase [Bacillota bacterium]
MKAQIVCIPEPGKIDVVEKELTIGPEDILVKTTMFSICGTDKNYYLGKLPRGTKIIDPSTSGYESHDKYPILMGHEGAGIVVETGSAVRDINVGDYVVSMGWNNCMADYWVSQYRPDGRGLILAPKGISKDVAALGDAVACSIYAGMHSGVMLGDVVAIVGCGFAGQVIAQIVKRMGAKTVICIEPIEPKLELAKKLGCDVVLNPNKVDVEEEVRKLTNNVGVDVVIETAGLGETVQMSTDILKHGGILGMYSWILDPVNLFVDRWHDDGFDIRTLAIMHRILHDMRWWIDKTMQVAADQIISIDPLLTHRFSFEDVEKAFECASTDDTAVKVGIDVS